MKIKQVRTKLLLSAVATSLLVATCSMLAAAWIVSQQYLEQANELLRNSSHLINDNLDERKESLLATTSQFAAQNRLGSTIWYLAQYAQANIDPATLTGTYSQLTQNSGELARSAKLSKVAIYNAAGELIFFTAAGSQGLQVGIVDHQPAPVLQVMPVKDGEQFDLQKLRNAKPEHEIRLKLSGEPPEQASVGYGLTDGSLVLECRVPVMGEAFEPATGKRANRLLGLVVTTQAFDQSFANKLARHTGVEINVFTPRGFLVGTLPSYRAPNWSGLSAPGRAGSSPNLFNEIEVDGVGFYQSLSPLYNNSELVGAIAGLRSMEVVRKRIRELIVVLVIIGACTLVIILPFAWMFANTLSRPMTALSRIFHGVTSNQHFNLAASDLSQLEQEKQRDDELGVLARSFALMTQAVNQKIEQISEINASLEQRVRDRTEALLLSKESLANAQRIANLGNWELDIRNNQLTWSDEIFRIFEIDKAHFVANYEAFLAAIHPEDRDAVNAAYSRSLETREPYGITHRLLMADGRIKYVYERCESFFDSDGQPNRSIGTVQDITAQKLNELELEQYRTHLESLVEERTVALSIAKDAAEAASRAKSTFLANMSHELRTPMNAIMGMNTLAMRSTTDAALLKKLAKIESASSHLLQVINDILDISRIEANQVQLEKTQLKLSDVLANIRNIVGQRADEKGLKFFIEADNDLLHLPLAGDPLRLGQILINLVGNAVKFTETGSVSLHAQVAQETTAEVLLRFEVKDSGIGISSQDQKRLFSAFEQADGSMTRKYGGTGLGLAISKRLAELMGGEIGVESQESRGSTFWFTARLSRSSTISFPPAPAAELDSLEEEIKARYAGTRILLAEDEPINQEVSMGILQDVGFKVDLAEDGEQAVALAQSTQYALILMDMQMPKLNGVEATHAIRALPGNARIPILAMTANAFDEDRQTCLDAGMSDHMGKPVAPEVLYQKLLMWLEQSATTESV